MPWFYRDFPRFFSHKCTVILPIFYRDFLTAPLAMKSLEYGRPIAGQRQACSFLSAPLAGATGSPMFTVSSTAKSGVFALQHALNQSIRNLACGKRPRGLLSHLKFGPIIGQGGCVGLYPSPIGLIAKFGKFAVITLEGDSNLKTWFKKSLFSAVFRPAWATI